jgi:hypothetical protein
MIRSSHRLLGVDDERAAEPAGAAVPAGQYQGGAGSDRTRQGGENADSSTRRKAVARPEERKFLGFSIANDGSQRRIAPKALDKFKAQIRDMTRRTRGISLPRLIDDLAPYLRNPPRGTVLMLSSSADHFSDLRGHSYERSYDGIWGTGGGFDGTGAATPVERRSEAGDCRGIGTPGIIWGCGCAAVRDLDRSSVYMAPTGSWVAGAFPIIGAWLHAGVGRAGG